MTMISTYIVGIQLEIEFIYGKVRKFRHQLADYSFSIYIPLLFCLHRRFIFDNRLGGEA